MRMMRWAAVALAMVLGGGNATAAVFTYDASISGVDDLGLLGLPGASLTNEHIYLVETTSGVDPTNGLERYSTALYRSDGTALSDYGVGSFQQSTIVVPPDPNCHRADCMGGTGLQTAYFFQTFGSILSDSYLTVLLFNGPVGQVDPLPTTLTGFSFSFSRPDFTGASGVESSLILEANLLPDNPVLQTVPLPASLPLFSMGIIAFGALAYQKRFGRGA